MATVLNTTRPPKGRIASLANTPLTKGLVFCSVLDDSGLPVDLVTGAVGTYGSTVPAIGAVGLGTGPLLSSTAWYSFPNQNIWNVLGPITCLAYVKIGSGTRYRNFIGKDSNNGSTNTPFTFRSDAGTNFLHFQRANATDQRQFNNSTAVNNSGVAQIVGVSATGDISIAPVFYINGVPQTGTLINGTATGAPTATTQPLLIGRRPDGVVDADHVIGLAAVWARQLSVSEHASLAANPWQLFTVGKSVLKIFSSGTIILPSLAAWGWAGGVPSFNVKTNIAGVTGTWGAAGNSPGFNQKTIITPSAGVWSWVGNAVTSLGTGGSLSGMVQGMVRGFVRLFVRGTNTGKP